MVMGYLRVGGLLMLTLMASCDSIDPNSPLGQRKAIFQEMLSVKEDLGGMLRGRLPFEAAAFQAGALQLDRLATQPWQYYPDIKEEASDARAAVWQQKKRFKTLARELKRETAALLKVTSPLSANDGRLRAAFDRVEAVCERCHKAFRAY